jgi:hypothetical protein
VVTVRRTIRRRVVVAAVVVALLAAGLIVATARVSSTRPVVVDCAHRVARSWRLDTLQTTGCRVWHVVHGRRHHRPAHPGAGHHRRAGGGRRV